MSTSHIRVSTLVLIAASSQMDNYSLSRWERVRVRAYRCVDST